jgi:hypothetical protein
VKKTKSAGAEGVCHASVEAVGKAVIVVSALVAVPGHSPRPPPKEASKREKHGWRKGFPVHIDIG